MEISSQTDPIKLSPLYIKKNFFAQICWNDWVRVFSFMFQNCTYVQNPSKLFLLITFQNSSDHKIFHGMSNSIIEHVSKWPHFKVNTNIISVMIFHSFLVNSQISRKKKNCSQKVFFSPLRFWEVFLKVRKRKLRSLEDINLYFFLVLDNLGAACSYTVNPVQSGWHCIYYL